MYAAVDYMLMKYKIGRSAYDSGKIKGVGIKLLWITTERS